MISFLIAVKQHTIMYKARKQYFECDELAVSLAVLWLAGMDGSFGDDGMNICPS